MTQPRRGEVWAFDVGRGETIPLAVVQSDALNALAPTIVGLVMTARAQRAGEPLVVALDHARAGLAAPAWVKVTQVRTVPASSAVTRLGVIPADALERVDGALAEVLSLGRSR
ncbi:MAG: type II toxin-antitoxin system PemK/MazF family toxin [Actinobacteria bacterium]|nr:type II toxin-antitoxin system PemK/MazF family toxin [Actinomycetota bacterium]